MKKLIIASFAAAASAVLSAAVPEISDVTMSQSAMRLVTITYNLADAPAVITLDVQTNVTGDVWASIGGEALWNATGDVWKRVETGSHTITWRPHLSWPDHKIAAGGARAVVTAWALDNTPDYMVVDISAAAQPNTQTYYPGADFVPGGVTNSLYKTTTLLMRKIMAKGVTWTMGSTALETARNETREATHLVTLANNYYIGVYEVTQSQWSQVVPSSTIAAYFTGDRFMRPMENMTFNDIRSASDASYDWPSDPHPSSFIGQLRSKTGIDFEIPSEAQWEFAARAGNGTGYWNDGSAILNTSVDANLNNLGRYMKNPSTNTKANPSKSIDPSVGGTAIVGSYAPNDWGIYDMLGNVWEWCLDWYDEDISTFGGALNIDPSAPANTLSGAVTSERVFRGGGWYFGAEYARPAFRGDAGVTYNYNFIGVRVVCTAGLE